MDSLIIIAILVFVSPFIFSIVALSKIKKLQRQMDHLTSNVAQLKRQVTAGVPSSSSTNEEVEQADLSSTAADDSSCSELSSTKFASKPDDKVVYTSPDNTDEDDVSLVTKADSLKQDEMNEKENLALQPPLSQDSWLQKCLLHFKQHWLVWVGGIALLVGIAYLVEVISQYIEITPVMRITAAFAGSCCVLLIAERFHRKEQSYTTIGFAYVPAVIFSAGCMGLYSTVIFSYTLYEFLPPVMSLLTMGGVSIFTLSLYLRFGPLMAVLGLIGGFTAPFWFMDQSSNGFGLAGYISFISVAGLLLAGHVKRGWIFLLVLVPHYLWTLGIAQTVPMDLLMLWALIFLTLTIYLVLGVPILGWRLSPSYQRSVDRKTYHIVVAAVAVGVLVMSVFFKLSVMTHQQYAHLYFVLLIAWLPVLKQRRTHSRFLSYTIVAIVLLVFYLFGYASMPLGVTPLIPLATSMMVISLVLLRTFVQHLCRPRDVLTKYLLLSAPVLLMAMGWWGWWKDRGDEYLWIWSLYTFAIVAAYWHFSSLLKPLQRDVYACMHIVIAISMSFLFSGTELTLVMALQVLVIAWQISKTSYQPASWVLKVVLMVAIARATLMSFVPAWQIGMMSVSGMLLLLVLLFIMFGYSYRLLQQNHANLANWLEGAIAQLMVVTVFSQSHYWLAEGHAELKEMSVWGPYGFKLSILYAVEALLISAAYQYRALNCTHRIMKTLYIGYANLLFAASLVLFVVYNTLFSPLHSNYVPASATPVLNWLSIGWLILGILILLLERYSLSSRYFSRKANWIIGGSMIAMWLALSIRQFWQLDTMTLYEPTSMAEQISYSFTGIAAGIAFALYGVFKLHDQLKLLGFAVLAVVIAKVVVIDTSALEGIHRAVSYLVLGGALVGLGWVFQRVNASRARKG